MRFAAVSAALEIDPAVELLGPHAKRLLELRNLISRGAGASVRVSVNGEPRESFGWPDFLEYNEKIKSEVSFEPVEGVSELTDPPGGERVLASQRQVQGRTPGQQECYEDCWDAFDQCDLWCDPHGGPQGCQRCYDDLYRCQNFCDNCPRDFSTSRWYVAGTPVATGLSRCLQSWPPGSPRTFEQLRVPMKLVTTYKRELCDRTIIVVNERTTYHTRYCWHNTRLPCSRPDGSQFDVPWC